MPLQSEKNPELLAQLFAQTKAERPELSADEQWAIAKNNYDQKMNAANPVQTPTGAEVDAGPSAVAQLQAYLNDPKRLAASKAYDERSLQAIEDQKAFATDAEKLLQQYASQPKKMDLSPLLQLSESWTGIKQGGYAPPPTQEQQLTRIAELQEGLRKAKGGVTASELQRLSQLEGSADRDARMLLEAMGIDARGKQSQKQIRDQDTKDEKAATAWAKDIQPRMEGFTSIASDANYLNDKIDKGRFNLLDRGVKAALSRMIVNYNVHVAKLGALANADLGLLQGAQSIPAGELDRWVQEQLLGKDPRDIKNTFNLLQKNVEAAIALTGDPRMVPSYAAPKWQAMKEYYDKNKNATLDVMNDQQKKSIEDMSESEIDAQLKALGG